MIDDLLDGGHLADGLAVGLALGIGAGLVARQRGSAEAHRSAVAAAVLLSLVAAGGAYACTPDTELARGLLGVVLGAGAAAVAAPVGWWWGSLAVTAALVVVAAVDGAGRASAVVGTIAIAVLHQAGQALLHRGAPAVAVLPIAAAAVAVCSRVAGLADTTWGAFAVAGPTLAVVAVAFVAVARSGDAEATRARGRQTAGVRRPPRGRAP